MFYYAPDDNENKAASQQGPHPSMAGKKVDADLEEEKDQPEEEGDLITQESQKGKKVDADPEQEDGKPTEVE
ncbi:MAG: hypothetical protein INR73_27265 [Williamsia sp.]|nr:hypothetical protein [Williamsia sp.]